MKNLNGIKFWPPVILLGVTTIFSLTARGLFIDNIQKANNWVLDHFSGVFAWAVLAFFILLVTIYCSPLGKVVIGGSQEKPLLSKWRWFAITLCTTIATGILFWGTAEPLFHLNQPPYEHLQQGSMDSATFAMSTMLMHWTLSPYAIYTLAALVFALCFYNFKRPFEVGASLFPLFGNRSSGWVSNIADIVCLYGLVAGMSASLGAGILSISGGINQVLGWDGGTIMLGLITMAILTAFISSASSGLMKGIRTLSDYNIKAFILLALIFLVFAPWKFTIDLATLGVKEYVLNFFSRSVNLNGALDEEWFDSWTVFNWANWLAWAPITALFLGKLGRGYSVRCFIRMNLIYPSLFGAVWMCIFSGSSIFHDLNTEGKLWASLNENGAESIIYLIMEELPFSKFLGVAFILITFLSYVTAADSNTSAMSSICTKGMSSQVAESPLYLKMLWGCIIGVTAWVMISYAGIEGVKMISVLGGFPALFLLIFVAFSGIKLILQPPKDQ